MMRFGLSIIVFIFCTSSAFAQVDFEEIESEKPSFKDRLYFGGNFGMQFGNVTLIEVSPIVGYMISSRLSGGVGVIYQYFRIKRATSSISYIWRQGFWPLQYY